MTPGRDAPETILIVTDAWQPQVNGVVRTIACVVHELRAAGHRVEIIGPDRFLTFACPSYREIRLAVLPRRRLERLIAEIRPGALHIATEGPLGWAARAWAVRQGIGFTTSLHTRFPEYVQARTGLPAAAGWALMRRFHAPSCGTLVATEGLRRELAERGFGHLLTWSRGVDVDLFNPASRADWDLPRPIFLYVGRVAVEKNIPAFLDLDLPGSKVVVGDGPLLPELRRRYPGVTFTGRREGADLARLYASADVFMFPSRTDTFGLVMLESMACGTPVAAFKAPGPLDVVPPHAGVLDDDLGSAAMQALALDRTACRTHAEQRSWRDCSALFLRHLVPIRDHLSVTAKAA